MLSFPFFASSFGYKNTAKKHCVRTQCFFAVSSNQKFHSTIRRQIPQLNFRKKDDLTLLQTSKQKCFLPSGGNAQQREVNFLNRNMNLSGESACMKCMFCVSEEFRQSPDERCKTYISCALLPFDCIFLLSVKFIFYFS